MKRTFVIGLALLVCVFSAKAQEADSTAENGRDRLEKLEQLADKAKEVKAKKAEKLVDFDAVKNFGFGSHLASDDFSEKLLKNSEIWVNVFDLSFNPAGWFSASLGVNAKWDKFTASSANYLYVDGADGNKPKFAPIATQQALYPGAGGEFDKLSSQLNMFSLEFPLAVTFKVKDFGVRFGAEAVLPLTSVQKEKAEFANTINRTKVKKVEKVPYYYGAYAEINYDELGVYVKYVPTTVVPGLVDELLTVGIVFGF